jgi:ribosome maturation factor RimP
MEVHVHFLLLHPVVKVLVPGDGELVLDDITHVHEILQPLLEDRVHAYVVCGPSVSVSLRRTKTTQNIP